MTTAEKIRPVLASVYGDTQTVTAMATYLAGRIDEFELGDNRVYGDSDRQLNRMIMLDCWNWFPGGGTAQIAADRVENALIA